MSGSGGNDSDLSGGIFKGVSYEDTTPPKREFKPWHRPRKQFVRDRQWCRQISDLIDSIPGASELRYFGLPGSDLLDLRCFHKIICQPRGLSLRYLGFNSAALANSPENTELNISLDEVGRLPNVDPASSVLPDDIRLLANEDSLAWNRTAELGPFDVINWDLCDGFAVDQAGADSDTYYNAVQRLMTLQSRRSHPWLLLLTTRVGAGHVEAGALKRLKATYSQNLSDCASFQTSSASQFKIPNAGEMGKAIATEKGFQRVFLVGLCKWLVKLGLEFTPQSLVTLKSAVGYRVQGTGIEDIVSLAIHIKPTLIVPKDKVLLANVKSQSAPDECGLAVTALQEVSKLGNVDGMFQKDQKLRATMVKEMGALLESARYDLQAYNAWAATH